MKYRIVLEKDYTVEELTGLIDNGGKFIIFQYCISLPLVLTLKRFSPAILIKKDDNINKYRSRYNLLTILFGWWCIPPGIINSIRSLNINKLGGIDITDDIMLNIDGDAINNREVELKVTHQLFCKPTKSDLKSFRIALSRDFDLDYNIRKLIVGLYINTKKGEAPHFTVGIKVSKNLESYIEKIRQSLYTEFYTRTHFEFIDLSENTEINILFEKQGETIVKR
ncbi:MAG TPA: hypothetical protein VE978_08195 [Chitinophagales bacterium]|nr:hypothetical protein [Chitinophagales bacterium]